MADTDVKIRQEDPQQPSASRPYRGDLFGWVQDQIALLSAGKFSEIDAVNIADELGDVGNEQYDKLESAVRVIILHFLKWDHQSERRSRSWVGSIVEQRRRVERILKKNPSLKPHIEEVVVEAYEDAVTEAAVETGFPEKTFPESCPYPWDDILNRVVALDDLQSPRKR
jgi:hypothetical protein